MRVMFEFIGNHVVVPMRKSHIAFLLGMQQKRLNQPWIYRSIRFFSFHQHP
jgi:hypothetical protein